MKIIFYKKNSLSFCKSNANFGGHLTANGTWDGILALFEQKVTVKT